MQEVHLDVIMKQYRALHKLIQHFFVTPTKETNESFRFHFTLLANPLKRSPSNATYETMVRSGLKEVSEYFNVPQRNLNLAFGDLHLQGKPEFLLPFLIFHTFYIIYYRYKGVAREGVF